jgi:circadian clock protein KaiC
VQGFGWSLDTDGVELMYRSPVDVYIDEWVYTLLETVERTGAHRVLIDSLSDLQLASPDPIRFREYMYSLVQRLARSNVSLFMTAELPDLFQTTNLSEQGISHLADNVVLLEYIREDAALRRALTVLKTRASRHEPETRRYRITRTGIVLEPAAAAAP